jgi:DNA modification methylase
MKPYFEQDGIVIYHADCRDVLPLLPDVDLVLTDPPYNVGLDYSNGDNRTDYAEWCAEWFRLCPQPLVFTPGTVNLSMWTTIAAPTWVCCWFKHNQASACALGGFNVWEPVLVYGGPQKKLKQDGWYNLVSFRERQNGAGDHPCPKTLTFWRRLIEDFTEPGDLVLDIFGGSGTTARACNDLGRRCISIDTEERYCEIAAKRLAQEVMDFGVPV